MWDRWFKFVSHIMLQIITTYTEAVQTIDPQLATGKLHTLWVAFAKFYEDARQIEDVRHPWNCSFSAQSQVETQTSSVQHVEHDC